MGGECLHASTIHVEIESESSEVLSTQGICFHTLSAIGIIPALIPLTYLSLELSSLGIHLLLAMSSVEAWNLSQLHSEGITKILHLEQDL